MNDNDHIETAPPHDLQAEAAVLGAMLLSRDRIADAAAILKPGYYYRPAHEIIHRAILDLNSRGDAADPITVGAELTRRGELDKCGGSGYLHSLITPGVAAANVEDYAEIVRDKYVDREFAKTAMRAVGDLMSGRAGAAEVMARVQADILERADDQADDGLRLASETMTGTREKIREIASHQGRITGVPTGFADLDSLTSGLQPGQTIIVAARPALGKSTLALDFVRAAAIKHRMASVMFSLEMGHDEINMRMLSAQARVGLHNIRNGHMTDEDWSRLDRALPEINAAPLWIDDSPNLDMSAIRAKGRRLKEKHDLRLMVIDYVQLLQSGAGRRFESRQAEVTDISRSVKLLAKELEIPIVALCQLNRGPEQRTDKKPAVSDLRESGSLEQDADIVVLLHREDAYVKESPRAGEADLHVAKHRNGPTATITLAFQGHYSRFVDMAQG